MKSKHTPTPWTQYITSKEYHVGICAKGGKYIGLVHNQSTYEEANANAEFIVRAVNSHEALLEAAKQAFKVLREAGFVSGLIEDEYDDAMKKLDRAITQAEGR